jgi:hypothetical protein
MGTVTMAARRDGIAAVCSQAGSGFIYCPFSGNQTILAPWKLAAKPISHVAFFDVAGFGGGNGPYTGCTPGSSGYQVLNLFGTNSRRVDVYSANGVVATVPSSTWKTGGPFIRGLTHDGATLRGYDDGVEYGNTADATSAIYHDPSFTSIGMGGAAGVSTGGEAYWMGTWNRVLTPGEWLSLRNNPWQLFAPTPRPIWQPVGSAAVTVYRPGSDVNAGATGWTGYPDAVDLASDINEVTRNDASYVESPTLTSTAQGGIFAFSPNPDVPIGTWMVTYATAYLGTSGQVRVNLLDGSNSVLAAGSWQAITGGPVEYTCTYTIAAAAPRFQIEVKL